MVSKMQHDLTDKEVNTVCQWCVSLMQFVNRRKNTRSSRPNDNNSAIECCHSLTSKEIFSSSKELPKSIRLTDCRLRSFCFEINLLETLIVSSGCLETLKLS